MPEPADDLFACILVVFRLLFPCRFEEFNAGNIRADDNQNVTTPSCYRFSTTYNQQRIIQAQTSRHTYSPVLANAVLPLAWLNTFKTLNPSLLMTPILAAC